MVIKLLTTENINVERKYQSVIKYVVNNLMIIGLTGRKEDGYVLEYCAYILESRA